MKEKSLDTTNKKKKKKSFSILKKILSRIYFMGRGENYFIWKSLRLHNFSQFFVITVTWQSVIGKEKIAGPCISDS